MLAAWSVLLGLYYLVQVAPVCPWQGVLVSLGVKPDQAAPRAPTSGQEYTDPGTSVYFNICGQEYTNLGTTLHLYTYK